MVSGAVNILQTCWMTQKQSRVTYQCYQVDDELTPDMVVAAIAAGSTNLGAKGYIIVDDSIFEDMNIDLDQTDGESKSDMANVRHFDAFLGGIEKRIKFAKKLMHDATAHLISKPEMKKNLNTLKQSGFIYNVNEKLEIELEK